MTRLLLEVYRPVLRTVLSVEDTAGLKRHGEVWGGVGEATERLLPYLLRTPLPGHTTENLLLSLHSEAPSVPGASVQAMTL